MEPNHQKLRAAVEENQTDRWVYLKPSRAAGRGSRAGSTPCRSAAPSSPRWILITSPLLYKPAQPLSHRPDSASPSLLACPLRWNQESLTTAEESGDRPRSALIGWEHLWNTWRSSLRVKLRGHRKMKSLTRQFLWKCSITARNWPSDPQNQVSERTKTHHILYRNCWKTGSLIILFKLDRFTLWLGLESDDRKHIYNLIGDPSFNVSNSKQ